VVVIDALGGRDQSGIALLALLAASEAFLVVRLVRNRPGDLSPA
jgi:hypothetical protein